MSKTEYNSDRRHTSTVHHQQTEYRGYVVLEQWHMCLPVLAWVRTIDAFAIVDTRLSLARTESDNFSTTTLHCHFTIRVHNSEILTGI
jgi:hypothetical protein